MSEPARIARDVEDMLPGLYHYSVDDDRIGGRSEAFILAAGGRLVLIDPLPIDPDVLARLGAVEAIVIAAPGHQRSAWRLRRTSGTRVYAPAGAAGFDEEPDERFAEDRRLPGDLRPVHAPGPAEAHYALYHATGPGVLLLGDLVMRGEDDTLRFLPDEHLADPDLARRSARRLLEYRFDVLGFGHGRPVLQGGRQALEDLLRREGLGRD
jgi:hypothetical protein